jgi:holin-like protein
MIRWLSSFVLLCLFQLLGIGLVTLVNAPLPGPVVGLALLAVALVAGRRGREFRQKAVEPAARSLLGILPLLFVPAGVGIVEYLPLLNQYLWVVLLALIVSFLLTLFTSAVIVEIPLRRSGVRTR